MSVRPARAKAHSPGQSEAAPWVIRIPSCVSRPVRAKAFIYVFHTDGCPLGGLCCGQE